MKVKLKANYTDANGVVSQAGSVVDLPDAVARTLIDAGKAVTVEPILDEDDEDMEPVTN